MHSLVLDSSSKSYFCSYFGTPVVQTLLSPYLVVVWLHKWYCLTLEKILMKSFKGSRTCHLRVPFNKRTKLKSDQNILTWPIYWPIWPGKWGQSKKNVLIWFWWSIKMHKPKNSPVDCFLLFCTSFTISLYTIYQYTYA